MKHLNIIRPPTFVFILALIVRILYNSTIARNYTPIYDAAIYNTLARNLIDRGCFCLYGTHPSFSRPPLWPFVMAIIYFFAGKVPFYAQLFYCFLGAGTCVIIYLFTRDLFGRRAALFSGILAAVYPCLFIYDGWLYTESLYIFILTACVYLLYKLQFLPPARLSSSGSRWFSHSWQMLRQQRVAIGCGFLIGLAALARPNGIFLIALVAIWGIVIIRAKILPWKYVLQNFLIIVCLAALIILPWTYRNYLVTHKFVFISMGLGEVLKGAYNDGTLYGNGQWLPPPHSINHDAQGYTLANDTEDTLTALSWIRKHLSALPYLLSLHFLIMWIPYSYSHGLAFEEQTVSPQIFMMMVILIYVTAIFVMVTAALGLLFTWKQHRQHLPVVYLLLAFIIGQNVIFYSDMRFRAPIEPMLVLLSGGCFWWIIQCRKARSQEPLVPPSNKYSE